MTDRSLFSFRGDWWGIARDSPRVYRFSRDDPSHRATALILVRIARVVLTETLHHVTERGIDRQAVFSSDAELPCLPGRQSNRVPRRPTRRSTTMGAASSGASSA